MTDVTPTDVTPVDATPHAIVPEQVYELERVLRQMDGQIPREEVTFHHFCKGIYCREYFMAAGTVAVGMKHAKESFFLLVSGTARFSTAQGEMVTVSAPYMAVTQPGSKRVVYAITDATFLTFHPNPDDSQDMDVLTDRFIIPEALPAPERELIE